MDATKLKSLILKRYLEDGTQGVKTVIPRHFVAKGDNDIRVVWDLTKNGLNPCCYAPSFSLPTQETLSRRIQSGWHQEDFDVGEQFHNYVVHPKVRPYMGVSFDGPTRKLLQDLLPADVTLPKLMRWARTPFGWTLSPYFDLRMFARAIEIAKGNPLEKHNPFHWTKVCVNLPGDSEYNPAKPRVSKIQSVSNGKTFYAAECIAYFDDGRVIADTSDKSKRANRQVCAGIQWLGNQDAARKRRPGGMRPGAWAGGVTHTDQGLARRFLSQMKWDRLKTEIKWIWEHAKSAKPMSRLEFRQKRGFLNHACGTYGFLRPYMRRIHLSHDTWRSNRNPEGWKSTAEQLAEELYSDIHGDIASQILEQREDQEPEIVKAVPGLQRDMETMMRFTSTPTPVMVIIRPVRGAMWVAYGFGDASQEGYGGGLAIDKRGSPPKFRSGFWCSEVAERTSNYRELRNLRDTLQEDAGKGRLAGMEVWLCTDNEVAERSFYKGSSDSEQLYSLIVDLNEMALKGQFILHVVHCAGTRMIQQGTDELSRGETHVGNLLNPECNEIPLHRTSLDRSPLLQRWLQSWVGEDIQIATPSMWHHEAQLGGVYDDMHHETWIWDLPPAAALYALEELALGRLKRHDQLSGVVLIPRLLKPEWERRLHRVVDLVFTLKAGDHEAWPKEMHESLTIGIYLPLLRYEPWDWKQVPFMVPMGSTLSALYHTHDPEGGNLLRKFWEASQWIATMPPSMVRAMLSTSHWSKLLCSHAKHRARV